MIEPSLIIAIVFVLYMIGMLGIGLHASRRTKNLYDFFLANRTLGHWVVALSSTASSESGWAILGTVGLAYSDGLSAWWFMPGCLIGYAFNWTFVASKLRKRSRLYDSVTIPDYLETHFDDRSHSIRIIAVIIIFLFMMGYVAAQLTAVGKAFDAIFHIPYCWSIIGGGAVIIIYTLLGGFRAVAWTDLIQGLLMALGLIILPIAALFKVGGLSALYEQLHTTNPGILSLTAGKGGAVLIGSIVGLLGIGLGYPGQPHVVTRFMAARDDITIRQGRIIALVWGFIIYSGAIVLGLTGRILFPALADAEYLFPKAATLLLPAAVSGLMLAAIMAAIMSTADSQLLVAASSIVRDLCEKTFQKNMPEKKSLMLSRITILILGLCSIIFALTKVRMIFWFVLFSWSGLGASFGPLILLTLYWPRVNRWGAITGMIIGCAVTILWKITGLSDSIIYELVPAFFLSGLTIIAISILTEKKSKIK